MIAGTSLTHSSCLAQFLSTPKTCQMNASPGARHPIGQLSQACACHVERKGPAQQVAIGNLERWGVDPNTRDKYFLEAASYFSVQGIGSKTVAAALLAAEISKFGHPSKHSDNASDPQSYCTLA